jgi:hypothetical protein
MEKKNISMPARAATTSRQGCNFILENALSPLMEQLFALAV